MDTRSVRARFAKQAAVIRKAVETGVFTVEQGKRKLHEALDDLIDEEVVGLSESFRNAAKESAKRELQKDLRDLE